MFKRFFYSPAANPRLVQMQENLNASAQFATNPLWVAWMIAGGMTQVIGPNFLSVSNLLWFLVTILLSGRVVRFFRKAPNALRKITAGIKFPQLRPLSRVFYPPSRLRPAYSAVALVPGNADPARPLRRRD